MAKCNLKQRHTQ